MYVYIYIYMYMYSQTHKYVHIHIYTYACRPENARHCQKVPDAHGVGGMGRDSQSGSNCVEWQG